MSPIDFLLSDHFKKIATPTLEYLMKYGLKIIKLLKSDFKVEGKKLYFFVPKTFRNGQLYLRARKISLVVARNGSNYLISRRFS